VAGTADGGREEWSGEVWGPFRRAGGSGRFSCEACFYANRDISLVPRPLQRPSPPLRVAATSADTYPAIGALGLPIFVAVRLGTIEELGPNIAAYRAAYRQAGAARARPGLPKGAVLFCGTP